VKVATASLTAQGYQPVVVSGYSDGVQDRYAAISVKSQMLQLGGRAMASPLPNIRLHSTS
jgi:Polyglycine hydrolase-like, structural repeat